MPCKFALPYPPDGGCLLCRLSLSSGCGRSNSIADQLLKDERVMGEMQAMLAKMVNQAFAQNAAGE